MKKVKTRKKQLEYYAIKERQCERAIAVEENKLIILIWKILKEYYTRKWERWYDQMFILGLIIGMIAQTLILFLVCSLVISDEEKQI